MRVSVTYLVRFLPIPIIINNVFRCVHITDIGIGYISTMVNLHTLYLRWCGQIRDFGLSHLCGMRGLQVLSLAGKWSRFVI